jgi:SAM-dependent methyltransferase
MPALTPLDETIEAVACNLCGADEATLLYRQQDCRFFSDPREWSVVRCRKCGLTYLNPRPTPASIWQHYPPEYYEHREVSELAERYEVQASVVARYGPGRLLDIGCANGDWIALLARRGWQVSGIEPSPNGQNPHGLDIRRGSLPDAASWEPETFDVVTAWAVVEHLHNPKLAFQTARKMLRVGGRFILMVPNAASIASRFAYREDVPRHLYMFGRHTLSRYAQQNGLSLEKIEHHPRFFGGTGRGVLRVQLLKALGRKPRDYFRFIQLPWSERVREDPILAGAFVPLAAVERLLLTDRSVRFLRLSGHVIAEMRRD